MNKNRRKVARSLKHPPVDCEGEMVHNSSLCAVCGYKPALKAARATKIAIGAQNMHYEPFGAYTSEISAQMLMRWELNM